jgi:hypothetical protein
MAGFWETILPGGLGAYGYDELMGKFDDQSDQITQWFNQMMGGLDERTQFQPWSVTSSLGTARGGPGGMSMQLSGPQQRIQNQMFSQGQDMLARASEDPTMREQDIYGRIRDMQMPGEQRAYNEMNDAAFRQGRTGMGTAQYGGTPEQLAFAKAQAEARNSASLGSMGQAQQELMNQYQMGSGMMGLGYQPQQQLLQQAGMGLNNQQLAQQAQMNNANLWAQLGLGGITADTNMANVQGNAFGNMMMSMMPILAGGGSALDDLFAGWFG